MIESVCQNCGTIKVFEDDKLGKKYKCPNCQNVVLIEKINVETSIDFIEENEQHLEPIKELKEKNNILGKTFGCIALVFAIFFVIVCIVVTWRMLFK